MSHLPISLMNRLNLTESAVFKMWIQYFQKISFEIILRSQQLSWLCRIAVFLMPEHQYCVVIFIYFLFLCAQHLCFEGENRSAQARRHEGCRICHYLSRTQSNRVWSFQTADTALPKALFPDNLDTRISAIRENLIRVDRDMMKHRPSLTNDRVETQSISRRIDKLGSDLGASITTVQENSNSSSSVLFICFVFILYCFYSLGCWHYDYRLVECLFAAH